jgi:hypothetical protein
MRWQSQRTIAGGMADVLAVAAPIERWSLLFPHIHWVRVHGRHGEAIVVEMTLWRGPLRLHWTAEQAVRRDEGRIIYRTLRGLTRGLCSEWRFEPDDDHVTVTSTHTWSPEWPLIGGWLASWVYETLVRTANEQTLDCLERAVVSGHAAALRRLDEARDRISG